MAVYEMPHGTFVTGLGIVDVPKYINYRASINAWVISKTPEIQVDRYTFKDRDYINTGYALKAAINELSKTHRLQRKKRSLNKHERKDKIILTGYPGIMRRIQYKRGQWQHTFSVYNPADECIVYIYIGTQNTYQKHYYEALDKAKAIRFEAVERYYQMP